MIYQRGSDCSSESPHLERLPGQQLVELLAALLRLSRGVGLLLIYNAVGCRVLLSFPVMRRDGSVTQ